MTFDAIIAGAGPAGLSAAAALGEKGCSVLVLERNHEIGSPIRTSGGSFIDELTALGIPPRLYHPIHRIRFVSPNNAAVFEYPVPVMCVVDVRGTFQFLAERAIASGAQIRLRTEATAPILEAGRVVGVQTRDASLSCQVLIDATGYHSTLLKHPGLNQTGHKQGGLDPGFRRFGVGSEYDLYAPHWDQDEAVLIVGSNAAPSGYGWIFPWGRNRVRAGVGIIHPDSRANPETFLDHLVASFPGLESAQPIEHHTGLIPSERFAETFTGDGILGVGDAVGQASSLLGEGIRWAIVAGRMAGEAVADAVKRRDPLRDSLIGFEKNWRSRFARDLSLAHRMNQRMARWDDAKWDQRLEIVKLLSPGQFAEALKTNLTGKWIWQFLRSNPRALAEAAGLL